MYKMGPREMGFNQVGVMNPPSEGMEEFYNQLLRRFTEEKDYNEVMIKKVNQLMPSKAMGGRDRDILKGAKKEKREPKDMESLGGWTRRVRHCPNGDPGRGSCANPGIDGVLRDLYSAKRGADLYNTGRVTLPARNRNRSAIYSHDLLSSEISKGVGDASNLHNTYNKKFGLTSDCKKHIDYIDKKMGVADCPTTAEKVAAASLHNFENGMVMNSAYSNAPGSEVERPKVENEQIPPSVIPKGETVSDTSTAGSQSSKTISSRAALCHPDMETDSIGTVPRTKASEQQQSVEQGGLHIPFAPKGQGLAVPFLPSSYGGGTSVKPKQAAKMSSFYRSSKNGQTLSGVDEKIFNYQKRFINAGILSSLLKRNGFTSSGNMATTTVPASLSNTASSSSSSSFSSSYSSISDVHNMNCRSNQPLSGSLASLMLLLENDSKKTVPRQVGPSPPAEPPKKRGRGRPRKHLKKEPGIPRRANRYCHFPQQLGAPKISNGSAHKDKPLFSSTTKLSRNGSVHNYKPKSSPTTKKSNRDLDEERLKEAYLLLSISQDRADIKKRVKSMTQYSPSPPLQKQKCGDERDSNPIVVSKLVSGRAGQLESDEKMNYLENSLPFIPPLA